MVVEVAGVAEVVLLEVEGLEPLGYKRHLIKCAHLYSQDTDRWSDHIRSMWVRLLCTPPQKERNCTCKRYSHYLKECYNLGLMEHFGYISRFVRYIHLRNPNSPHFQDCNLGIAEKQLHN